MKKAKKVSHENLPIKKWLAIYGSIIGVIIIGIIVLAFYCQRESEVLRSYTFTLDNFSEPQDGLNMSVSIPKYWESPDIYPTRPLGAEYDIVVMNNSHWTFSRWSAELIFSDECTIDSSWNGEYSVDKYKVNFVADAETTVINPYSSRRFGAVLYSKDLLNVERCVINGYREVSVFNMAAFWVFISLLVLVFIFMSINVAISIRTARFVTIHQRDVKIIRQAMNTLTDFIDAKDSYTKGHSSRVAAYSRELARRIGVDEEELDNVFYVALMHDCGKIGVPDAVLKKPDKLTKEEYAMIQSHTTVGDTILTNFTSIPNISDGAHFHHERFDGNGYPTGIRGKDIPLYARIICIADSTDAMSSNRCYRDRLSDEQIIAELRENAGKQFDPDFIPHIVEMISEGFIEKVQKMYPNNL